jgi:hypothetical protein
MLPGLSIEVESRPGSLLDAWTTSADLDRKAQRTAAVDFDSITERCYIALTHWYYIASKIDFGLAYLRRRAVRQGVEMPAPVYPPHIDLVLQALRIGRERLNGRAKVAIDPALLRALLQAVAQAAPFSPEFYTGTYRDVAEAHAAGRIPDLHHHYVTSGFLEGRLGACPDVDDAFYLTRYPDVARAIARGEVASAQDHYVRAGGG